jgi:hypothetical protein
MAIGNEENSFSATIWYLERSDLYKVEKPYQTTFDTAALGGPTDNLKFVDTTISVQDAQHDRGRFSIDTNGFQFCRWPTSLSSNEFGSDESVRSSYYLEVKQYVQQLRSGATHVHVMSHTVSKTGSLAEAEDRVLMFSGVIALYVVTSLVALVHRCDTHTLVIK